MAGMKRIGVLWKGKEGGKAVLSGSIDLLGQEIKIGVFLNDDENRKETSPKYHIVRYSDTPPQTQRESAPPPDQDLQF